MAQRILGNGQRPARVGSGRDRKPVFEVDRAQFDELCNLKRATGRPVRQMIREAVGEYLAGRRWLAPEPEPRPVIRVLSRAVQ